MTHLTVLPPESFSPPPDNRPRSYEVRVRYSVGETLCLIGHDRRGAALIEVRVDSTTAAPVIAGLAGFVEDWCRGNELPVALARVPE